jgi:protein tyrosine kinase modulator
MDLRDYLKIIRKRGWIIVLLAVIAVASAYGFSKAQTPIYRSTIKLSVEPSRASDYGQTLAIKNVLRNYVEQLRTRKMAQKVVDQLQMDIAPETLLGIVSIDSDEANYTIQVEAKHPLKEMAPKIVETFANLFVQQRQIANLAVDQQDRILTSIVDSATAPELFSPKTSINMLAGGVLGALLGVIVLFVIEWLESDIVRSNEDVERFIGVPVIGTIPTISERETASGATARPRLAFWRRA